MALFTGHRVPVSQPWPVTYFTPDFAIPSKRRIPAPWNFGIQVHHGLRERDDLKLHRTPRRHQLPRAPQRQQPRPMQEVPTEDQCIRFDLLTQLHQRLIKHRTLMQIGSDEDSGGHESFKT